MYRKILVCVLAASMMILIACGGESKVPAKVNTEFTSKAVVNLGDKKIECKISRINAKAAYITICTPEELKGMTFSVEDNIFSVSYEGLSFSMDELFIPGSSFVSAVLDVLERADSPESLEFLSSENGISMYQGDCDYGKFKLAVNSKTGFIEKISMENPNVSVEFFEQETY